MICLLLRFLNNKFNSLNIQIFVWFYVYFDKKLIFYFLLTVTIVIKYFFIKYISIQLSINISGTLNNSDYNFLV